MNQDKSQQPSPQTSAVTCDSGGPDLLTPLGAACLTALVRIGDNSAAPGGTTELSINAVQGQLAWGTVDGYLNSGQTAIQLVALPGGGTSGVSWTVDDAGALVYSHRTYGTITNVAVQAIAVYPTDGNPMEGPISITWSSISITFYDVNNNEADSTCGTEVSASQGDLKKGVDPLDLPNSVTVYSPPSGFTAVRVTVEGYVQLLSQDSNHPNVPILTANELVGKIYVWAASCAAS